jgi:hypothetical protein
MIFSKFGCKLSLVSKSEDASGRVWVQGTADGSPDIREFAAADLKADEGLVEINRVIAQLPPKVVGSKVERRRQTLC